MATTYPSPPNRFVLVEFTDYECGSCRRENLTLGKQLAPYGDAVELVIRQMPLPFHTDAMPAAVAAEAAREQSRFSQMHQALLQAKSLNPPALDRMAQSLGLDMDKYHHSLRTTALAKVKQDMTDFSHLGLNSTPSFLLCTPEGKVWNLASVEQISTFLKTPQKGIQQ